MPYTATQRDKHGDFANTFNLSQKFQAVSQSGYIELNCQNLEPNNQPGNFSLTSCQFWPLRGKDQNWQHLVNLVKTIHPPRWQSSPSAVVLSWAVVRRIGNVGCQLDSVPNSACTVPRLSPSVSWHFLVEWQACQSMWGLHRLPGSGFKGRWWWTGWLLMKTNKAMRRGRHSIGDGSNRMKESDGWRRTLKDKATSWNITRLICDTVCIAIEMMLFEWNLQ